MRALTLFDTRQIACTMGFQAQNFTEGGWGDTSEESCVRWCHGERKNQATKEIHLPVLSLGEMFGRPKVPINRYEPRVFSCTRPFCPRSCWSVSSKHPETHLIFRRLWANHSHYVRDEKNCILGQLQPQPTIAQVPRNLPLPE